MARRRRGRTHPHRSGSELRDQLHAAGIQRGGRDRRPCGQDPRRGERERLGLPDRARRRRQHGRHRRDGPGRRAAGAARGARAQRESRARRGGSNGVRLLHPSRRTGRPSGYDGFRRHDGPGQGACAPGATARRVRRGDRLALWPGAGGDEGGVVFASSVQLGRELADAQPVSGVWRARLHVRLPRLSLGDAEARVPYLWRPVR